MAASSTAAQADVWRCSRSRAHTIAASGESDPAIGNITSMNSTQSRMTQQTRTGMPTFGAFQPSQNQNASILLGRSNAGLRRSTPDSEALASSDDESEQTRGFQAAPKINKNTRRTSWLTDIPPSHRKPSITTSGPYSPSGSHPVTPSADSSTWAQAGTPVIGNNGTWNPASAFPWGLANSENQRPVPSRLQEVLHSPTAITTAPKFLREDQTNIGGDRAGADTNLPFAIPIQPTPKNYRSQSYSVGQLDTGVVLNTGSAAESARPRGAGPFPNLQRRSSRPGMLGERLHDGGVLDQVAEVEDDEEAPVSRQRNDALAQSQEKIEQLQKENANLRMGQVMQERARTASSSEGENGTVPLLRPGRVRGSTVQPGPEAAIDDNEDGPDLSNSHLRQHLGNRGFSEQYTDRFPLSTLDDRNLGRAHWQTSQRFETVLEPPQSRRHSFADVPTRQGSFSSTDNNNAVQLAREQWFHDQQERDESYHIYGHASQDLPREERRLTLSSDSRPDDEEEAHFIVHQLNRESAAKYFGTDDRIRLAAEARGRDPYAIGDPYGRPRGFGAPSQPLFIVTFKCYRADVFYIQEGTGLQVNPGDLVMVEADRGTDLGSVMQANITWDQARALKEYYAEEHYKLLMMFSDEARNGGPNALNPNGLPGMQGAPGSAIGGMGPPGHPGHHEPSHSDIKPKMIRRLAQNHEIEALKEKERNEAKAKRVCRQKVGEHRLNMEVLDAEFQMDQKKLTFYYFAEKYINFNSLVTDLFKIYKTRIWMSAINPASFITPTSSLAQPLPYRAMGGGRASPSRRGQFGLGVGFGPSSPAGYDDAYDDGRSVANLQGTGMQLPYFNPYQTVQAPNQQNGLAMSAYGMNTRAQIDPFTPYTAQSNQMFNPAAATFAPVQPRQQRTGGANHSPANANWAGGFGSLSLGS